MIENRKPGREITCVFIMAEKVTYSTSLSLKMLAFAINVMMMNFTVNSCCDNYLEVVTICEKCSSEL